MTTIHRPAPDPSPEGASSLGETEKFEFLYSYEDENPVGDLRLNGLAIWPLVRSALISNFIWRDATGETIKPTSLLAQAKGSVLRARHRYLDSEMDYSDAIRELDGARVLVFDDNLAHKISHGQTAYDRILDPFVEMCRDIPIKKFHLQKSGATPIARTHESVELPAQWLRAVVDPAQLAYWNRPLVAKLEAIEAQFQTQFGDFGGNLAGAVFGNYALLRSFHDLFVRVLSRVSIDVVVLSAWAGTVQRALILACKDLGIVTVDVQHGQQGRFSANYGRWSLPSAGYPLFPSFFWLWGQGSFENLSIEGASADCAPTKIIGGNPYLALWKEGTHAGHFKRLPDTQARMDRATRRLLVTLQPFRTVEELVPAQLLETVRNGPKDWLWTFRNHPNGAIDDDTIAAHLIDGGCAPSQFIISAGRGEPLPMALRDADWHLTAWSTCGYEALIFETPTLLYYPFALDQFKEYVDNGTFFYASDPKNMLDILTKDPIPKPSAEQKPWIIAERDVVRDTFEKILSHAIARP